MAVARLRVRGCYREPGSSKPDMRSTMPGWFLLSLALTAASVVTACGVVTPTTAPPTYRDFGHGSQA